MGMIAPARGRVTYGGRADVPPVRRAIVFQRPVMLRRTVLANIRYALGICRCAARRVEDAC